MNKANKFYLLLNTKKIETQGIEFVKDSEGYVSKKPESELSTNEKIISEKEYKKKSGLKYYEKEFENSEARKNTGRKQKFASPLKFQIRVTKEEKDFISYAREHNINYDSLMKI